MYKVEESLKNGTRTRASYVNGTNFHSIIEFIPIENKMIRQFQADNDTSNTLKRNPFAYVGARMASIHAITYLATTQQKQNTPTYHMASTVWLFAIAVVAIVGSGVFMCMKHKKIEKEVDEEKAPA